MEEYFTRVSMGWTLSTLAAHLRADLSGSMCSARVSYSLSVPISGGAGSRSGNLHGIEQSFVLSLVPAV